MARTHLAAACPVSLMDSPPPKPKFESSALGASNLPREGGAEKTPRQQQRREEHGKKEAGAGGADKRDTNTRTASATRHVLHVGREDTHNARTERHQMAGYAGRVMGERASGAAMREWQGGGGTRERTFPFTRTPRRRPGAHRPPLKYDGLKKERSGWEELTKRVTRRTLGQRGFSQRWRQGPATCPRLPRV